MKVAAFLFIALAASVSASEYASIMKLNGLASSMIDSIHQRSLPGIQSALDSGFPVNAPLNSYQVTALILAAEKNVEMIEFLLSHGADINAKDKKGSTALHLASGILGRVENARKLIASGASLNEREMKFGFTPLHLAIANDKLEIVQALVEAGADAEAIDNAGNTPIILAAYFNRVEIIEYLMSRSADHLAVNNLEHDALAVAVIRGNLNAARVLLEKINPTRLQVSIAMVRALALTTSLEMRNLVLEYLPSGTTYASIFNY